MAIAFFGDLPIVIVRQLYRRFVLLFEMQRLPPKWLRDNPNMAPVDSTLDSLRYPIGRFTLERAITEGARQMWIAQLENAPGEMRAAVSGLSDEQLDTPYRPGGWTVRQVVHHVPDSHMNAYMRYRFALTEDAPTIKPYAEGRWAELADARTGPVAVSLALLESLHQRWTLLMRSLSAEQWTRKFYHPERGIATLEGDLPMYAWHGRHHVAHITALRQRMGWNK